MRSLARMLSPEGFEKLQSICYRGENVDGINHRHWRTGEILTAAISPHSPRYLQEGRTSRVALHKVLMDEVPDGLFRYGKNVIDVEKQSKEGGGFEVRLTFADGTTENADIVVAADGLYSVSTCPLFLCLKCFQMNDLRS
jgi:2-polyprenyl-6-methoxyphenol hydroxylase-like FAD-dependent oxidoreductase